MTWTDLQRKPDEEEHLMVRAVAEPTFMQGDPLGGLLSILRINGGVVVRPATRPPVDLCAGVPDRTGARSAIPRGRGLLQQAYRGRPRHL